MITFQCNTKLIQDEGGARLPRPLRFIREFEYFFLTLENGRNQFGIS